MLYNKEEFAKMDYNSKIEFFKKCEKDAVEYQTKTKAEMILDIALYLKKTDYVVKDIKNKILEDLGDLVTSRYVDMCLTDEFKPRQMKRKEKEKEKIPLIAADGSTLIEPEQNKRGDREDLTNLKTPSIGVDVATIGNSLNPPGEVIPAPKIDIAYVENLERQLLAFKGEIGYTDMLATHRIAKLSNQSIQTLINSSKKCAKFVYVTIDIRNNEATKIIADKDWKKSPDTNTNSNSKPAEKTTTSKHKNGKVLPKKKKANK